MANINVQKHVPSKVGDIVDPILSSIEVTQDEGLKVYLSYLKDSTIKLNQQQADTVKNIIQRLKAIKASTESKIIRKNLFFGVLEDFEGIKEMIKVQVFQGVKNIDISEEKAPVAPPVVQQKAPVQKTKQTPQKPSGGGLVSILTGGDVVPTGSKSVPTPQQNATPSTTPVPQQKVTPSADDITAVKNSINPISNYQKYLEVRKLSYSLEDQAKIDAIIPFLEGLVKEINTTDLEQKLSIPQFQERIFADIRFVKKIAQHQNTNNNFDVSLQGQKGDLAAFLSHISQKRNNISQQTTKELKQIAQQALNSGVDINSLSSFERAIFEDTGMIPQKLGDVGTWEFNDFTNSDDYNEVSEKMEEIQNPNTSLQRLVEMGEQSTEISGRWLGLIPDPYEWLQKQGKINTSDIRNYLKEIDREDITEKQMQLALKQGMDNLKGSYKKQTNYLLDQLKPLAPINGQPPKNVNLSLSWNGKIRTFSRVEDKAKYITTQLVLLEGMAKDTDTLTGLVYEGVLFAVSIPGSITENISEIFAIENLIGLLLLKTASFTFVSALPIWGYIKLRAGNGKDNSDGLIDDYKKDTSAGKGTFESWLRGKEGVTPKEKKAAINLFKHYEIIDSLIAHVKDNGSIEGARQIDILEKFRESNLMNLGNSSWKMMLEQELAVGKSGGIAPGFRAALHRFARVNLRGGWDVNIRTGVDKVFGGRFESHILKMLGIKAKDFRELLKDDTLKPLNQDKIKNIKNNAVQIINSSSDDEAKKVLKRDLLRDYIAKLPIDGAVPEKPFLYAISDIVDNGGTSTDIKNLAEGLGVPKGFDIDRAESRFINPEKEELDFETKKRNLRTSIGDIQDDDIREKLLKKLSKITIEKSDELDALKDNYIKNVKKIESDISHISDSKIKDAILKETLNGDSERLGHIVEEVVEVKKILPKIAGIKEVAIVEAFHEKIRYGISINDDAATLKSLRKISEEIGSIVSTVGKLDSSLRSGIMADIENAVKNADEKAITNIKEGLANIAKIKATIDTPPVGMSQDFVDKLKNSLNHFHASSGTDWEGISSLRENIKGEAARLLEVARGEAAAKIAHPGGSYKPIPETTSDATPEKIAAPERKTKKSELTPEQKETQKYHHDLVERAQKEISLQKPSWDFNTRNMKGKVTSMIKSGSTNAEIEDFIKQKMKKDGVEISSIRSNAELTLALAKKVDGVNLGTSSNSIDLDSLGDQLKGGGAIKSKDSDSFWKGVLEKIKTGEVKIKL